MLLQLQLQFITPSTVSSLRSPNHIKDFIVKNVSDTPEDKLCVCVRARVLLHIK